MAKLQEAPFYKNASPEKKQKLLGLIYDKVLTPAWKQRGQGQIPAKEAWIKPWLSGKGGELASVTSNPAKFSVAGMQEILKSDKAILAGIHFLTGIKSSLPGEQQINELDKDAATWMASHYDNSLKDRALKKTGAFAGQLPIFEISGGLIGEVPIWNEAALAAKGKLGQFVLKGVRDATEGALVGKLTDDDPLGSALGFAVGGKILRTGFKALGGGSKLLSRLMGLGGAKAVKDVVEQTVEAVERKAPETLTHPVVTATAGKLKEKLNASMLLELNKVVEGGNFLNASPVQKAAALAKLGKLTTELSNHLAAVNGDIIKMQAAADLAQQRATNPAMHDVLSKLEKASGESTVDTITKHVTERAKLPKTRNEHKAVIEAARREFLQTSRAINATSSVGAASAKSLEFEDNLSKMFPTSIKFEDRGHKFLAALNVLVEDAKANGGKVTPQQDELFRALLTHLQEKYPGRTLQDMMEAGENVWRKLGEIVKASNDPSVQKWGLRFFRQSSVFSNEAASSWKHEVELYTKSGRYAEEQGLNVGSRYRIGATKNTAELLEVGLKTSKVRLPNNKIAHVSNEQLVDASKNIVQAQEEILKRRAARTK